MLIEVSSKGEMSNSGGQGLQRLVEGFTKGQMSDGARKIVNVSVEFIPELKVSNVIWEFL